MGRATKKVLLCGKFGPRYGSTLKKKYLSIMKALINKQLCSECGKRSIFRIQYSIWKCKKCEKVFSGGAYKLRSVVKIVNEKK
mmetsp:Transcript_1982/g.2737  ORF Transcript_1982/g.2737 Transcript_1982/m.2737 type:complete len:83 (-) Transcript_1982:478-726(-)